MINRILIVGYGSIGKRHLRIVRETFPAADIRVLRHRISSDTIEFANGSFSNLSEACGFLPQVAIIANPAPFHIEVAIALANRGCHLLIEKPLSHELNGVKNLLELVEARNLVLQVGYNLRFSPSLQQYKEFIQEGIVGRVLSIRCEVGQYLPTWRPGTDYPKSVSARSDLGGGALLELSHELDYLRWIFGDVKWISAWFAKQSNLQINVEDTAHMILQFQHDGNHPGPVATVSLDFIRRDVTRVCTVIGELGSIRWDGITNTIDKWSDERNDWQVIFQGTSLRDDSYLAQWNHFLNCVNDGHTTRVNGCDGLAVLEIIASARKSAALQSKRINVK